MHIDFFLGKILNGIHCDKVVKEVTEDNVCQISQKSTINRVLPFYNFRISVITCQEVQNII